MSPLARPFAHLNLRHNPFGELEHETLVELAVVDVAEFANRLRSPRQALQFVGGHGRGKTTRLRALHAEFVRAPYLQVYPESPKPAFTPASHHFVDSVDYLSIRDRRRLYRAAGSLAVTTHEDLSAEFAKSGYAVISVEVGGASLELVSEIIRRRIEHARRGSGLLPTVEDDEILELIARFGDDIRGIESELYERFQGGR